MYLHNSICLLINITTSISGNITPPLITSIHLPFTYPSSIHPSPSKTKMVCSKCQKKLQKTELATPGVKKKSEMYYGSPSTTVGGGGDSKTKSTGSATMGSAGIGKVSLFTFFCLCLFFMWN